MTQLKDSMSNVDKIRQEIERRKKICEGIFERESDTYYQGKAVAYGELLPFIDSLPGEIPPYCTGFKGDPDPPGISDLEQAAENIYKVPFGTRAEDFIAGAEWQKEQDGNWLNEELMKAHLNGVMTGDRIARESLPMPEDTVIFQKGVAEGRRLEMEDGLAWQDIKSIVQIADKMLDDPKARVEYQNHNEEYYYKRVLEKYYDR